MKYSFMSFSCPGMSLEELLDTAKIVGYDGVELRVGGQHFHGVEVDTDLSTRRKLKKVAEAKKVPISCLATSCTFTGAQSAQDDMFVARRVIDLAADFECDKIRVFGGDTPLDMSNDAAVKGLSEALAKLAIHGRKRGVHVCLETHDHWSDSRLVAKVMKAVNDKYVCVNWDIMHPVRIAGLSMDESFEAIKPWIKHVHIHDGGAGTGPLKPIGKGVVDHKRAIELLKSINYDGFLSGEWINWEPYEIHLPRELATMRQYEKELGIS